MRPHRIGLPLLLAVSILATLPATSAAALDPADFPPVAVRLTADGAASERPKVAFDNQGHIVLVWEDGRYGNTEILWQRFTLLGTALTGVERVTETPSTTVKADVSCDAAGRSHIVWQEGTSLGSATVYLGRRELNGAPAAWSAPAGPSATQHASVAALAGGESDVVSYRWTAGDQDVYYRRYLPTVVNGEGRILSYVCERGLEAGSIPAIEKDPVVAIDAGATARLLWSDMTTFWQDHLREATVNPSCQVSASAPYSGTIANPAIDIAGSRVERIFQVGSQILRATGSGACRIPIATAGTSYPAVGTTADTSYVVWEDSRSGNLDVYLAEYVDCSNLSGDLPLVLSAGQSRFPDIAVSHSGSGEWVAVWQENLAGNTEIFMTSSRLLDPSQPFLIGAATFDRQLYHNGQDQATITIVTQSLTGTSGALQLHATLRTNTQESHALGTDGFSLSPGETHVSTFTWSVPWKDYGWDFSLDLELTDGGTPVLSVDVPKAASGTALTAAQIETAIQEIMQDECSPPVSDCTLSMLGMLPVVGPFAQLVSFQSSVCAMGQAWSRGDYREAAVEALGAVLGPLDLALEAAQIGGAVVSLLIDGGDLALSCGDDLLALAPGGAVRFQDATFIDSLATDVETSFAQSGRAFTTEALAQGEVAIRVGAGTSWTDAETASLTDVFVFPDLAANTRWAHVGVEPVPLGSAEPNPLSAIRVELSSIASGNLEFGLLRPVDIDSTAWIRFPTIPLTSQTVAWIDLADTTTVFALRVDLDGDGMPDQTWYPSGSSVGAPEVVSEVVAGALHLETWPNPTVGGARLGFYLPAPGHVNLSVFDAGGRRVATVVSGHMEAGRQSATWSGKSDDGTVTAPGIFFVRLESAWGVKTEKIALLR